MSNSNKPNRLEIRIDRKSVRRALVVGGTLIPLAIAGASFAVPVTFTDGNVLTAKQLNDNFADLEQRIPKGNNSGTRLKQQFLQASDGARQYSNTWRDTQRNEDCTFEMTSDGKRRCLATGWVDEYYFYYLDSLCTRLVVLFAPPPVGCATTPTPKYFRLKDQPAYCGSVDPPPIRLHQLIGPVTLPSTLYDIGPQHCQVTAKGAPSTFAAFEYGGEIAPSNFVEATPAVDP